MTRTLPALACIAVVSVLPGHALAAPLQGYLDTTGRPTVAEGVFGPATAARLRPIARTARRDSTAAIGRNGLAVPPASAPPGVVKIIAAGNKIATRPYKYGGGHGSWADSGYDCSGSVSYALHGAGLLDAALDSSGLAAFGERGPGRWVTIMGNPGHAYMVVAGLRFDTSSSNQTGNRWTGEARSPSGYSLRHPRGL